MNPGSMSRRALPSHIGFIPDGNRRWASQRGLGKEEGYRFGVEPGLSLVDLCRSRGVPEISIYGYTRDNMKRPSPQTRAFRAACVEFAQRASRDGAALMVVGDDRSANHRLQFARKVLRSKELASSATLALAM